MDHRKLLIGMTAAFCLFSNNVEAAKKIFSSQKKETLPKKESTRFRPYTLFVPKGWECIDDKTQLPTKVEMVLIGKGKGRFTPSINLATETSSLEINDYVNLAKRYHESQGETACRSLGTLETKEGAAQLLQIDRKTQWGSVRFIQAALIKNGTAYVITATCHQDDFNENSSNFFKTIQSFTINPL